MTSMVNSLVARMSTDFLIGFSALFSLINPLGMPRRPVASQTAQELHLQGR
jgi:hypothetical protein